MARKNKSPEKIVHDDSEKPYTEYGIHCPCCDGVKWSVNTTRNKLGHIMRLRICEVCKYRLLTHEAPLF
jgi:C4-type Zn-finger protein